jgi:phosphoglycerate dehydrogenase-like enzyme
MEKNLHILITIPFKEESIENLREIDAHIDVTVILTRQADDISDEIWGKTEILYTGSTLPGEAKAPNLRWIQFHSAGVDKFVDHPLLSRPNLVATTLSGANAIQAAEHALAFLLVFSRHLHNAFLHQSKKNWPSNRGEEFEPREIYGSTVGIIGYGSIGRQIARLLQPFQATILATKENAMSPQDRGYILQGTGDPNGDFFHRLYPPQALNSLVKECDYVIVTLPLTNQTRNLISTKVFSAMKPSAYLIDVSRGGIVDHRALHKALQDKQLAGAGLDVFPEEPLTADNPFWEMPNVIITPHIAGISAFYNHRAMTLFQENLRRYLENQPLLNTIVLKKGY